MIRSWRALYVALLIASAMALHAQAQSAQDVCAYIQQELKISSEKKSELCQDFEAGITRSHIMPVRALELLRAVNDHITSDTQSTVEGMLSSMGDMLNPATGDLPVELLIRRMFEGFGRAEALKTTAQDVLALGQLLQGVAQTYHALGIFLEPNVSEKTLRTEFGDIPLTVPGVDTTITDTAAALDRFERKLNRDLNDSKAMKDDVMSELQKDLQKGALSNALVLYINAHTTGSEWVPLAKQLAATRGRS